MDTEEGMLPPTRRIGPWFWLIDGDQFVHLNTERPYTEEEARAVLAGVDEQD
jgi:hypothetical protein